MEKGLKSNAGGKRENSGRKPKFQEETVVLHTRVPKTKAKEIKAKFEAVLQPYLSKKQ